MRKFWIVAALMLCLTGCAAEQTFETVSDELVQSAAAPQQEVMLALPDGASLEVAETAGKLYICDDYTVAVQTMEAGDLDKTLRTVTGYGADALTVMHTRTAEFDRYECVWTAAGEGQEQVGRLLLLDDGSYHYTVTVMAPASVAGQLTENWQSLLASVRLGSQVSTGS